MVFITLLENNSSHHHFKLIFNSGGQKLFQFLSNISLPLTDHLALQEWLRKLWVIECQLLLVDLCSQVLRSELTSMYWSYKCSILPPLQTLADHQKLPFPENVSCGKVGRDYICMQLYFTISESSDFKIDLHVKLCEHEWCMSMAQRPHLQSSRHSTESPGELAALLLC